MHSSIEKHIIQSVQPIQGILGGIFTIIGVLMFGIVAIVYSLYGTFSISDFENIQFNLPYLIPGFIGFVFLMIGGLVLLMQRMKRKRIIYTIRKGTLAEGKVIQNIQNFNYRVNHIPQRKVTFQANGESFTYAFFGEEWAQLFTVNRVFNIRHDKHGNAYPDPAFLKDLLEEAPAEKQPVQDQFVEAAQKMVDAAEKMLNNGDKEAALSFYESAYNFYADAHIRSKIIMLANELNDIATLKKYSSEK